MARSVQGSNREVLSNSSVSLSEGVYVTNGESLPAIIGKSGYFVEKWIPIRMIIMMMCINNCFQIEISFMFLKSTQELHQVGQSRSTMPVL